MTDDDDTTTVEEARELALARDLRRIARWAKITDEQADILTEAALYLEAHAPETEEAS